MIKFVLFKLWYFNTIIYVCEADLEEVASQEAALPPHAKVTRQDVSTAITAVTSLLNEP